MAQVQRHRRAIAVALFGLATLAFAPARAENQGPNPGTDLYDRPVLAIDPGMHTAAITSQAVDAAGHFAVTGSADRTVRVWSIADLKLLRTIWIPVGPESVGAIFAVAISPDGSTIAAGGWTERITVGTVIYLFERESGKLIRRIAGDLPNVTRFLTFSPDGRYLAATLGGKNGLRIFDRDKEWSEAFRDDQYGGDSYGATFARDGRLVTTALDGMIRLYTSDPNMQVQTKGEFGGVGIQVAQEDDLIKVVSPIEGAPAVKAGLLSGDVITAIDDEPTQGLTLAQAVEKMRGAINSPVKLQIIRGPEKEVKEFTITRDVVRAQSVFRRVGEPVRAPSGRLPFRAAFSPNGNRLAVGYYDVAIVDVLDGRTFNLLGSQSPADVTHSPDGLDRVAWSTDSGTLFADGAVYDFTRAVALFRLGPGRSRQRTADNLLRFQHGGRNRRSARWANPGWFNGVLPGPDGRPGRTDLDSPIPDSRFSQSDRRHARVPGWPGCRLRLRRNIPVGSKI